MCEMFGVSSDRTIDVTAELKAFFRHGEFNPHGWGIATWNDAGRITIDKEPVDSTRSAKIVKLLANIHAHTHNHVDLNLLLVTRKQSLTRGT